LIIQPTPQPSELNHQLSFIVIYFYVFYTGSKQKKKT
jgi:hypothetical protein